MEGIHLSKVFLIFWVHFLMFRYTLQEIKRVEALGVTKVVVHPGNALKLDKEKALRNISEALNEVLEKPQNLLLALLPLKVVLFQNLHEIL